MEENKFKEALKQKFEAGKTVAGQKFSDAKEAVSRVCKTAKKWCGEHPYEAASIIGGALAFTYKLGKTAIRLKISADEDRRRSLMTYDRRTDCYLQLRRPLKKREQAELDDRMANGESKTHALGAMGLLK